MQTAGFFYARPFGRLHKKRGRSPRALSPAARGAKAPASEEGEGAAARATKPTTRTRDHDAAKRERHPARSERERLAPGNKASANRSGRAKREERHGERKHQLGKSRTNTERHCQRAPKGLTGREAEAQAGADAPEGGVQAAQAAALNVRERGPLRMVL